ncbi:hypothetical protein SAMD00019534_024450 [Acytostelium subglobosum LB1]|uniref:hypothetical protein n=1 Tax=Acytostelium subglobosum LB1 TaxID=1410327 RepID=UPI000644F00C|nr:hypothetical protein SAMD00019534_024450 [Acytostelium subglobosum LB1]GAM19270.1 hypothetical protein SAMD00019534_024450 [Acytostelium subglobosum LB1]|eukprot:XP_012757197.1 hypothetical protein SAMD00019534_024450 [Acytostelium subglobosum LB1]
MEQQQQPQQQQSNDVIYLQGINRASLIIDDNVNVDSIDIPRIVTAANSFVGSKGLNREQKVLKLTQLCQIEMDQLYDCETTNGSNHVICDALQAQLHNCMTSKLCPGEQELKAANCDNAHLSLGGIQQFNKCMQINKRLNNCLEDNLLIIWSTPFNINNNNNNNSPSLS